MGRVVPPPSWFLNFGFDPLSAGWIAKEPERKWHCVRLFRGGGGNGVVYAFLSKADRDAWRQNSEDRPFTFRLKPGDPR